MRPLLRAAKPTAPGADAPTRELVPGLRAPGQPGSAADRPARLDKRVGYTTLAQLVSQFAVAVLGFVTLKLVTNGVGLQDYGVYATCFAFTSTFSLISDFGVNAVTAREIAKAPEQASHIVTHNIGLRLALTSFTAPVVFGVGLLVYRGADPLLYLGIGLIALTFIADGVRAVVFGYYTASTRNDVSAAISTAQQVVYLLLVVLALASGSGLPGIFIGYLVASVLSTLVVLVLSRRRVSVVPKLDLRVWRGMLRMSASLGAIQVINMLYLKIDGVLLSVLAGTTAVGIYAVAYAVINGALTVPGFLMSGLFPSLVNAKPRDAEALIGRAFGIVTVLAALLVSLLATSSAEIVRIISRPEFYAAATPLLLLAIASAMTYMNTVFGYVSAALNVHQWLVAVSASGLLLNVVLNVVLIPRFSFVGAAAATLVCETLALVGVYVSFRIRTRMRVPVTAAVLRALVIVGIAVGSSFLEVLCGLRLPDWPQLILNGFVALGAAALVMGAWTATRTAVSRRQGART